MSHTRPASYRATVTREHHPTVACGDCALVLANGTDGWGLDPEGRELGELHAAKMQTEVQIVLDPDGETTSSTQRCDGCDTTEAGYRHPASCVIEVVNPADTFTYRVNAGMVSIHWPSGRLSHLSGHPRGTEDPDGWLAEYGERWCHAYTEGLRTAA